jgi:hypothetical protein
VNAIFARAHDAEATTEILKVATAHPRDLGLGFTTWSLPKLEEYLRQRPTLKGLARSTIRRLRAAGLRYRAGRGFTAFGRDRRDRTRTCPCAMPCSGSRWSFPATAGAG